MRISTACVPSSGTSLKRCSKCGEEKPTSGFYRHPETKDGLNSWCKDCTASRWQDWRARHPNYKQTRTPEQRHRWAQAEYRRDPTKKTRECQRRRKENPLAYAARTAVGNALQSGRLVRPSACSACGKPCKPDGHHEDYTKPLEVVWVCKSCHYKLDKAKREREALT